MCIYRVVGLYDMGYHIKFECGTPQYSVFVSLNICYYIYMVFSIETLIEKYLFQKEYL